MRQLTECSPNFSEGRRQDVIAEIVDAIRGCGVQVLDVQMDPDDNRTVVSFVGDLAAVEHAAVAGAARAAALIDMTEHSGDHPRMGATDVIPFMPLAGVSLGDCVALSQRVGQRIAEELDIPVYLYGEAATRPERVRVEAIRKGEYEGIRERIATDPTLEPDFGAREVSTAGATAVGARHRLVAFSVYLDSDRLGVSEAIARAVREDSGGLMHVHAEGFEVVERGLVGVAATLLRPEQTPLHRVLEAIRREAARFGVSVLSSEILGLVPQATLFAAAEWYLQLEEFRPDHVLESRMVAAESVTEEGVSLPRGFVDAVASEAPTPGGGGVAALAGALGAALSQMVANLTVGREKHAAVEGDMKRLRTRAIELQRTLLSLMAADGEAFDAVMAAYRLEHETPELAEARRDAIQTALRRATEVPLETMRRAVEVLRLARIAAELGNPTAVSDAGVAGYMAFAAIRSASLNVDTNIRGLRDLEEGDRYRQECKALLRDAGTLVGDIDRQVRARIAG